MATTDILSKTTKGDQEIATQANKLPIKHRSVLIMIDGKNSEEFLQKRLSAMFDGKAILNDLETHGFITRKPAAAPSLAPPAAVQAVPETSFLESIVSKVKDMSAEYEAR